MRRMCSVLVIVALALSSAGPSAASPAPAGPCIPAAPFEGPFLTLRTGAPVSAGPGAGAAHGSRWHSTASALWSAPVSQETAAHPIARAQDLVGGNFPIANFADQVSNNTDLDYAVVAWNSRRNTYLVVWHAYGRAHNFDILGREVTDTGATPNPVFPIIQSDGAQGAPALAFDAANNQFWLAWVDVATGTERVMAQRLSTSGQAQGSAVQVSSATSAAWSPRVACSAQRCVVTYISGSGDAPWVEARSLGADGNPGAAAVRLCPAGAIATDPDVAYNPLDNQFLAVWDQQQPGTSFDILGQVLSPEGAPVGGLITVVSAADDQVTPRVAYSTFLNRYCVVWADFRNGNDSDVFGRILSRAAAPLGDAFQVYAGPYQELQPAVAAHGTRDQFVVTLCHDLEAWGLPAIMAVTVTGGGTVTGSVEVRSGDNDRWYPQVAQRSGSDDYLVTCMANEAGGEADVFAQRVRYDRTLTGTPILVCAGRKGQESPGVAYNGKNDRYLAAWQDYRSVTKYDIRGRPFAPDGTLLAQEVVLSQSGRAALWPVVASLPGRDDALVAWVAFENVGLEFRGRRIGAAGQALGNEVLISGNTQTYASWGLAGVANPGRNEYLVVWSCFTEGSYNIYAQRLSAEAAPQGANLPICRAADDQNMPRVVYNPHAREYLIVWSDYRSPGAGIYGQRLSELGALVGGEMRLGEAVGSLGTASLAWNVELQEYLLVWRDRVTDQVIYGRRLNATAQPLGAAFAVTQAAWQAYYPALGYDGLCHDYLLTWMETRDSTDSDVVGGHLGADGRLVGERFDVAARTEIQQMQQLAQNSTNGEFVVVWMDAFAGSWDVFGQRWINACLPTPTPQPSATPTQTQTPTRTSTPTLTQTPTRTPTQTPTQTPTRTSTQNPTQTRTRTPTVTETPNGTRTATVTQTPTSTQTGTPVPVGASVYLPVIVRGAGRP